MEGDAEAVAFDLGLFAVGRLVAKDRNDHLEDETCFNRLVFMAKKRAMLLLKRFIRHLSKSKDIFCFEILYLNLNC